MSSIRRKESSRANGARSKGPKTPEGKSRSSLNALRHGMLANVVLLPGEPEEVFLELCTGYMEALAPRNSVEVTLVEKMAAACWRERRGMAIEKTLMAEALNVQTSDDPFVRLTEAFKAAAATHELGLIHRYETRLDRIYHRALHNLHLLRKGDLSPSASPSGPVAVPPSNHPVPNEPSSVSGHPGGDLDRDSIANERSSPVPAKPAAAACPATPTRAARCSPLRATASKCSSRSKVGQSTIANRRAKCACSPPGTRGAKTLAQTRISTVRKVAENAPFCI